MRLITVALAVYRFTLLLHEEAGPFHIFDKLRDWAGVYTEQWVDVETGAYKESRGGDGFFAELLNCPYCLSGWVALLVVIAPKWIAFWGGVWGLVYLLLKKTYP